MNRVQGITRLQLEFGCLEERISKDNPVRVIDAFVNKLELEKVGFVCRQVKVEGRPSFEESVFLKIYFYWKFNGGRSGAIGSNLTTNSAASIGILYQVYL